MIDRDTSSDKIILKSSSESNPKGIFFRKKLRIGDKYKNSDFKAGMASYMERTAETSTGGPPSIVLMISRITGAGSPLYS